MVKDIIPMAFDFIETHILDIILVVLLLFCMAIYIVLNNIKFPKGFTEINSFLFHLVRILNPE